MNTTSLETKIKVKKDLFENIFMNTIKMIFEHINIIKIICRPKISLKQPTKCDTFKYSLRVSFTVFMQFIGYLQFESIRFRSSYLYLINNACIHVTYADKLTTNESKLLGAKNKKPRKFFT